MGILEQLSRRKRLISLSKNDRAGKLGRSLATLDLLFLGIGSTLGVGIYILSGSVAKEHSGPAITISFFISASITILAGICYAELGARAPTSGSIYSYSYMTLGEFMAYLMGWTLITEYMIGAAGVIKAFSIYLDSFFNNSMQNFFREIYEIEVPVLAEYFDIFAFFMAMTLSVMLSYGLKESVILNNALTTMNISLVLFFVILGTFYIDWQNWNLSTDELLPIVGRGGFLPYGVEGVIQGAAACFYGFIGFDCIATTGEEVQNPKRIPVVIIATLSISFLFYLCLSAVLTLMVPYYLLDDTAPLSYAFGYVGLPAAQTVVRIGSFFGLSASLIGAFFPVSRIIYSMAQDGLLFRVLGRVHRKHETPIVATLVSGILTGLTAALLDVKDLINLNSLGTLLSYTIVAFCIIALRYSDSDPKIQDSNVTPLLIHHKGESNKSSASPYAHTSQRSTRSSSSVLIVRLIIFCVVAVLLSFAINTDLPFNFLVIIVLSCLAIFILIRIRMLESNVDRLQLSFQVSPRQEGRLLVQNDYTIVSTKKERNVFTAFCCSVTFIEIYAPDRFILGVHVGWVRVEINLMNYQTSLYTHTTKEN